ncbi:hypothetical protein ACFONC_11825 [Luteimonas soli]|uniref:Uncharacterized protein n=1 Tax=Luteimonas soli TaxID=1648966 RepID=A0ABV7XMR8_9GAMM
MSAEALDAVVVLHEAEQKLRLAGCSYEQTIPLRQLRTRYVALLEAAHRADGEERPGRPERGPGHTAAEWTMFLRGWDAHADAVFRSGLRAALEPLALPQSLVLPE